MNTFFMFNSKISEYRIWPGWQKTVLNLGRVILITLTNCVL